MKCEHCGAEIPPSDEETLCDDCLKVWEEGIDTDPFVQDFLIPVIREIKRYEERKMRFLATLPKNNSFWS